MISRHDVYEDTFMVLSHTFHPLRDVALCLQGAQGLQRIFCCNKMEKTSYCGDYVYITTLKYVKCCKGTMTVYDSLKIASTDHSAENNVPEEIETFCC